MSILKALRLKNRWPDDLSENNPITTPRHPERSGTTEGSEAQSRDLSLSRRRPFDSVPQKTRDSAQGDAFRSGEVITELKI